MMRNQTVEIEADSLEAVRDQLQTHLDGGGDSVVLKEDILADGKPRTIEALADSIDNSYGKAESQLPNGARLEKRDTRLDASRSSIEVQGEDEPSARKLVSIGHGQRLESFSVKARGRKGFLGVGKSLTVFEAVIFQQAVVKVTFRENVKVRFQIGTLEDKYEAGRHGMNDGERARLLRRGTDAEKLALLRVLTKHGVTGDTVQTLLGAIDSLVLDNSAVQREALNYLVAQNSMPATAWKLAYDLRDRALYSDELTMPLSQFIAEFDKTPSLGQRANSGVDFVRAHVTGEHEATFQERFSYFTRDEKKVSKHDLNSRRRDKSLCLQCGIKMKQTPQGPYVQLRCDACDISRFEKRSDL